LRFKRVGQICGHPLYPAIFPPQQFLLAISPQQRSWDATPVHKPLENRGFYNGELGWKVELSFNGRVSRGYEGWRSPANAAVNSRWSGSAFQLSTNVPGLPQSVDSSAHKIDFQNGALKVCIRSAVWLQRYAIIQSPKVSYFRTRCHFLTTCFSKC